LKMKQKKYKVLNV